MYNEWYLAQTNAPVDEEQVNTVVPCPRWQSFLEFAYKTIITKMKMTKIQKIKIKNMLSMVIYM